MKKKYQPNDKEIAKMKRRGIPVPSTMAEVKQLLKEGEESGPAIPLDEAFQRLRTKLNKRWGRK